MEKSWKFQGGRGSNAKPSGTENPVGWGVKLEKNPPWGGGGEYGYFLEPYIAIKRTMLPVQTEWYNDAT